MPVRVRYAIQVAISSDDSEAKDLGNGDFEIVDDTQGEGGSRKITLAASAVDVALSVADVASAKFFLLRATPKDPNDSCHEVLIRLNGIANQQLSVKPLGTSKEAWFWITTSTLTSVHASNAGATDMALTIFVAGD